MPHFESYLIASPILGAVIGYITNWVAIKMMFRPHVEKRIFGKRIPFTPGLIPSRRYELSKRVGATISNHLLTDETLINSLLSKEVKESFEAIIDAYLTDIKMSGKTIGNILTGSDPHLTKKISDGLCEKLLNAVNDNTICDKLKQYGKNALDQNKTISDMLPDSSCEKIQIVLKENSGKISKKLADALESVFFNEHIKPVILDLIGQNLKGLASFFVTPEKVYGNIFDSIMGYLSNADNYEKTANKIADTINSVINSPDAMKNMSNIFDKHKYTAKSFVNSQFDLFAPFINDIKEKSAEKLVLSLLNVKVADAAPEINSVFKPFIMEKYDYIIKTRMPAIIKTINLPGIIENKINEFEIAEAEEIIVSVVDKELKAITYFGGLLGFIIGISAPVLQYLGLS